MKKLILMGSVIALCLTGCDKDDDDDNNNMNTNSTDQMFITNTALSNTAEVMAGQLAATKATNAGVKAFGQMMATEHTQAQTDLKSLSGTVGMTAKDSVDAGHQALMQRLNTLTGYDFDTAYINSQVMDHQKTVTIFQTEISGGSNQNVKAYANKYLPHIQMHLARADSLQQAL